MRSMVIAVLRLLVFIGSFSTAWTVVFADTVATKTGEDKGEFAREIR